MTKTLIAIALAGLALAGCQSDRPSSYGATATTANPAAAAGVAQPAGNTVGLPRNDTTGANEAQNCTSATTDADRQRCLDRGIQPTAPSDRPKDGGS